MTTPPLEPFTFFIDRCLGGKSLAQALRNLNIAVEVHDDHFAKNALDVDWLPAVGARGWIVLTKDGRIGKRTLERMAVANANVKMFVLASQNLSGADTVAAFTKAVATMQRFTRDNPAPFIAKVYRDGRVSGWKSADELREEFFGL
ncbi:MAG: hypothetical protein WBA10_10225 [Elainellaceae cyanobacterium]